MIPSVLRATAAACLAASVAAAPAEAQVSRRQVVVAAYAGLGIGHDESPVASVGAEVRAPALGRVSPAVAISYWQFSVACDLLAGSPCDGGGWSVDVGAVTRLTPRSWSWTLSAATRIGRLYYNSPDRGVWDPSLGVTADGRLSGRLGWQAELAYHALMANRSADQPYRPRTADQLVLRAGIHVSL